MRKFVLRVLLFTLIVVLTLITGEFLVRSMSNPYKTKQKALMETAPRIKTLILGNSHTYFGLRPDMMGPGALNLANVSQTLKYDRRLLEKWLPKLDSLQTVILQVDYTTLFDLDMEDTDEKVFVCNYPLYMDLKIHPWYYRYNYEIGNFSTYKNKLGVLLGLQESKLQHDSLGHGESYSVVSKYEGWQDEGKNIALRHTRGNNVESINSNISVLTSIIRDCRQRNIQVIFVTLPEWKTYRQAVDRKTLNLFKTTIDSISRAEDIPWFFYWSDTRFGEDDFYDPDHLTSDKGASKMTEILMDDMKRHFNIKRDSIVR